MNGISANAANVSFGLIVNNITKAPINFIAEMTTFSGP